MAMPATDRATLDPLARIIRKIPRQCFTKSPVRAYGYLLRDFLLIAFLLWAILAVHSWLAAPLLSVLLGCVMTGLFVIGHDAGHGSFSNSARVNTIVGHLTSTPVLWPYHVWRLTHDVHHRWTHHADREIAWRPLTSDEFEALPAWQRRVYALSRKELFFVASLLFQFLYISDALKGVFFEAKDAAKIRFAIRLTTVVGIGYFASAAWFGGFYGVVFLLIVPQLVYQFWLSTFTLLHHTSPGNQLLDATTWSPERAQLTMSVQIFFPRLIDWLTHDISWHVPHHVSVGIPHYRLREAHQALRSTYPQWVQEHKLTWSYVRDVIKQCHLIRSTLPGEQEWLKVEDHGVGEARPFIANRI